MCGIVITDYTYAGVYIEKEQQRQKEMQFFFNLQRKGTFTGNSHSLVLWPRQVLKVTVIVKEISANKQKLFHTRKQNGNGVSWQEFTQISFQNLKERLRVILL